MSAYRPVAPQSDEDSGYRFSMPPPVGGWNARDNIAKMPPTDALILDNFFPSTTDVGPRLGSLSNATITEGQHIKTLMGVALQDGTFKRFAASETGIWDFTAGGVIGAASSAATTGIWESVQMNVAGVSYLFACSGDGTNKARIYNGTTGLWTVLDTLSTPALTGVVSTDVTNVDKFKNRVILCVKDKLSFFYGGLNSVGGAFTEFPLGSIFNRGGYLVATGTWSIDAGQGLDDLFLAISSEGEVVVYKGTDPSGSSTFTLVGVFDIGKPTGKRCLFKLAGDVGILTEQGLWPISKALLSTTVDRRVALTSKIQQAFNAYYANYKLQYGWQAVLLSKAPAILVNVPYSSTQSYQFVMNTITGSWCRFTDWNASCMLVIDGRLFFAVGNTITEGWVGLKDNSAAILCSCSMAFSYGNSKARGKKINLVKPILQASAPMSVSMALDTDFQQRTLLNTQTGTGSLGAAWDTARWDIDLWTDGYFPINKWKTVRHKPGGAFSLRLRIQVKDIVASWASTDYIAELGGLAT